MTRSEEVSSLSEPSSPFPAAGGRGGAEGLLSSKSSKQIGQEAAGAVCKKLSHETDQIIIYLLLALALALNPDHLLLF